MKNELELVLEFHQKFHQLINRSPSLIAEDRSENRYRLMKEEVEEYKTAVQNKDLPNVAKELSDILYTVYGTIIEHGLQDAIEEIFAEVHRSNMSKDSHEYKMIKGEGYVQADVEKFLSPGKEK